MPADTVEKRFEIERARRGAAAPERWTVRVRVPGEAEVAVPASDNHLRSLMGDLMGLFPREAERLAVDHHWFGRKM